MVSEITIESVRDYCGVTGTDSDLILSSCMKTAKAFILSYTGVENIDLHDDFEIAYYVLINDMYNNRMYTVKENNINPIVKQILSLHSVNLICGG